VANSLAQGSIHASPPPYLHIRGVSSDEPQGVGGQVIEEDDFMQMHKAVESYLKRVLFIALRKKGVSYKNCQGVIKSSFLTNDKLFEKVINLLNELKISETYQNDTLNVKVLFYLFHNFSSVFRNRIVHGIIPELNDKEVLKYCYIINKNLIMKIEESLFEVYSSRALDNLETWKFDRRVANDNRNVENIIAKYRLGARTRIAISKKNVKEKLSQIGINIQ
jgi:hypothetical protein